MYTKSELIVMPIALFVMICVAIGLHIWLKNKSEKIQNIPFIVITALLWVGEIVKQILELTSADGYNLWAIPLHFCSTYFIWFTLAEFTRGNFQKRMKSVAFVATFYLIVGMYIGPRDILGGACDHIFASFYTAHTFFFHHLVVQYALLTIAFKRFQPIKKDCFLCMICMATYYVVALIVAHALKVNFFNLLYSNVGFMEALRVNAGQVVYTIVFGLITAFSGALFTGIILFFKEKGWEKFLKKGNKAKHNAGD